MTNPKQGAFALRARYYEKAKRTAKQPKKGTTQMSDRFGGISGKPYFESKDGTPMYPDPYNPAHFSEVHREISFGSDPERDIFRMNATMEADAESENRSAD